MSNLHQQNSSQNLCVEGFSTDKGKYNDEDSEKIDFNSLINCPKTENQSK